MTIIYTLTWNKVYRTNGVDIFSMKSRNFCSM